MAVSGNIVYMLPGMDGKQKVRYREEVVASGGGEYADETGRQFLAVMFRWGGYADWNEIHDGISTM